VPQHAAGGNSQLHRTTGIADAAADTGLRPDAIPRIEPRTRSGNPPFYDVFGKRYYVLSSSVGYWSAASRLGTVPASIRANLDRRALRYVRHDGCSQDTAVARLRAGHEFAERPQRGGPGQRSRSFVGNRIIDLSYSAAAKLGMLRNGTAMVDVRAIDPSAPPPVITASVVPPAAVAPAGAAAAPESAAAVQPASAAPGTVAPAGSSAAAVSPALFVQAGAFSDPANAERLAEKLRGGSFGKIFVRDDRIAGRRMYRVRIGPVPSVAEFDRVVAALERAGINDAHLALD